MAHLQRREIAIQFSPVAKRRQLRIILALFFHIATAVQPKRMINIVEKREIEQRIHRETRKNKQENKH